MDGNCIIGWAGWRKIEEGCISCNDGGGNFISDAAITIIDSWKDWLGLGGLGQSKEWEGKGRERKKDAGELGGERVHIYSNNWEAQCSIAYHPRIV